MLTGLEIDKSFVQILDNIELEKNNFAGVSKNLARYI